MSPDYTLLKASQDSIIYISQLRNALQAAQDTSLLDSLPPDEHLSSDKCRTKRRKISPERAVLPVAAETSSSENVTLINRRIDIDFSIHSTANEIRQFIQQNYPESNEILLPVKVAAANNLSAIHLQLWSKSTGGQLVELRTDLGDCQAVLLELEFLEKIAVSHEFPQGHSKRADEFSSIVNLRIQDRANDGSIWVRLEAIVTMISSNEWSNKSLALTEHWYPVVAYTFPEGKPQVWNATAVTARNFYEAVTVPPRENVPPSIVSQHLTCELFPYQTRTLRWMLRKEGYDVQDGSNDLLKYQPDLDNFIPPLFFKGTDRSGKTCWASHILGIASTDVKALFGYHSQYKGGILAEEMGLGKTVELIALILLNRRPPLALSLYDDYSKKTVIPSSATLIIAPPSILRQWQDELSMHAPSLKVFHYQGVKKNKVDVAVHDLLQYDVVLTTYDVLSAEIYFAQTSPDRSLREVKRYIAKSSPLVQISWWRVCIDEAQMIETGVSNSAVIARIIPRINAWALTGTPVRKDTRDLLGLLIFLRYEPFCSNSKAWKYLILYNKPSFESLFGNLTLRHVKESVRDEINLPPQNRVIVTLSLSHIEEQNYGFLFEAMCNECGVSLDKLVDPELQVDCIVLEKLKRWLVKLRQTCTHPEVGSGNRKALGGGNGPLRSVNEVLDAMIEQHGAQLRTNEKTLFSLMLKRGQVFEHYGKTQNAMQVYQHVLEQARRIITECRENMAKEQEKNALQQKGVANSFPERSQSPVNESDRLEDNIVDTADEGKDKVANIDRKSGPWRLRIRTFLEVEHAALFLIASIYYQMKTIEEKKGANGAHKEKITEYEKLEAGNYEEAKAIRKELLGETENKAQRFISVLKQKAKAQQFADIPELMLSNAPGGIETRSIIDELNVLKEGLNKQANVLDEYREMVIQGLQHPLIDEGENASGAEFEESINFQEKSIAYLEAIKALVSDREVALTGRQNILIEDDLKRALGRKEAHTALLRQLVAQRNTIMPQKIGKPMRELLSRLRGLLNTLKQEASGTHRHIMERKLAEDELCDLQEAFSSQLKANAELEKELDLFRDTINARVDFYRQLQAISDSVTPYEPEMDRGLPDSPEVILNKMIEKEESVQSEIAKGRAKEKYLTYLKTNSGGEVRICVICQCNFEIGTITVCGHQYCKECISFWFKSHRTCPLCKKGLKTEDIHPITYKPEEASFQAEGHKNTVDGSVLSLYTEIGNSTLKEIKLIDLPISFGSKIDMICRHLIWIKRRDHLAKCVVFSQWSDVLSVLERALAENNIGFSSMTKDGVGRFKKDSKIQCFLLHAKSQSAGLTLVNATHVFICEPLLNPGIELQAISRVHRIGQTKPTTVWLYVVSNTVEESVLRLATRRRLALIGDTGNSEEACLEYSKPVQVAESKLDTANSFELRLNQRSLIEKTPGGGEMVREEDLLECLVVSAKQKLESSKVEKEVKRHLFAEAAERRIREKEKEVETELSNGDIRPAATGVELPLTNPRLGQAGPSNYAGEIDQ